MRVGLVLPCTSLVYFLGACCPFFLSINIAFLLIKKKECLSLFFIKYLIFLFL